MTSCVEEMKKADFEKRIIEHATGTINNVWYAGSANDFDYFIHNTASQSRKIRLKTNEITLAMRFPLTDDKQKWQLIKGDADPFLRGNPIQSLDNHSAFRIETFPKRENNGKKPFITEPVSTPEADNGHADNERFRCRNLTLDEPD
jgi:hypothetical protein